MADGNQDAVDFILKDHEVLRDAMDTLKSAEQEKRSDAVTRFAMLLRAHSHAEEQHVYPALEVVDEEEKQEAQHGAEEHHEAEALLVQLEGCPPDSQEFEGIRDQLLESVTHHMQEEEEQTLPALRATIDAETLIDMGRAFEEQRMAEISAG